MRGDVRYLTSAPGADCGTTSARPASQPEISCPTATPSNTTTGTVQLKAKFDNKSGTLWAGQFVAASLRLFVEDSALVVPAQCVVTGQRGTYVFVIDSANIAQQRPVTVERSANGLAVIASGVRQGERVVTDGQSRLTQGAQVDLRSARDTAGGAGSGGGGGGGGRGGGRKGGTKAP